MKTLDFFEYSKDLKTYFEIVIDKQQKEVFATKNTSCTASLLEKLSELYKIEYWDVRERFYIVFSGTEINEHLIPKKYSKFKIINS